jgi:hypothetical protein
MSVVMFEEFGNILCFVVFMIAYICVPTIFKTRKKI